MNVRIGYDGSDSARDAIHELHRAGLPADTKATVMSVADVWPRLPAESYAPPDDATAWREAPIVPKARALAEQSVAEARSLAAEGGAMVKAEFPAGRSPRPRTPARPTER